MRHQFGSTFQYTKFHFLLHFHYGMCHFCFMVFKFPQQGASCSVNFSLDDMSCFWFVSIMECVIFSFIVVRILLGENILFIQFFTRWSGIFMMFPRWSVSLFVSWFCRVPPKEAACYSTFHYTKCHFYHIFIMECVIFVSWLFKFPTEEASCSFNFSPDEVSCFILFPLWNVSFCISLLFKFSVEKA